jgi:hypothetical protein
VAYRNGDSGLNTASERVTSQREERRLDRCNINATDQVQALSSSVGLPNEMEDEFAKYVLLLEDSFRFVKERTRHLALQVAENNFPHPFNREKGTAGGK